ncbi:hypothetical protein BLSTO_04632 [Blastocystis sp. subtype 1]
MCRWSVSALSLFCRYSARVMVAVTGLSLVHHCSVTGLSLVHHCSVTGLSLVHRCSVTGLSLVHHCSVTGLSLVHHCSVTGSSLLCHWSVAGSSLLCSGHSRWSWSLIVRHSCATALPVPLSAGLSLLSLTCLLEPWSLIRRLSAARLPLVHLIVHRYSSARCSVCLSITGPSLLRLLARRLSVCSSVAFLSACLSAGPSLVCLLVRRCSSVAARPLLTHCWSACLSITGCHCPVPVRGRWSVSSSVSSRLLVRLLVHRSSLVRRWSVAGLSPRPSPPVSSSVSSRLLVRLLVHRSSLVRRWSVAGPLLVRLLVHRSSLVGLLGSGSLPRGWSAARLSLTRGWSWSLVRLLVRRALLSRCSACLSITGLSARPLLSCLLFVHQSVCSSHGRWLVARPSAARRCSVYWSRNWPVPGLSARSSLVHLITHRSSVYSSLTGLSIRVVVTGPTGGRSARSSLVHGRGRSSVYLTRHWLSRALLVCRSCVKVGSSICHSCIARASAQVVVVGHSIAALSTGLVVTHLLVLLLESWWPLRRSSICSDQGRSSVCSDHGHWLARPSLVCRWCVVGVSLVCRWCVVGVSFVHLFVHRSCIARPLVV